MGNVQCKQCCCREKPDKHDEKQANVVATQPVGKESDVKVVTNQGSTIHKDTDTSEPQDPSGKKNSKPVDIEKITIDDKDKTSKDEPEQRKNGKKKKKQYVESSSDTSSSSSSSDEDSHIEKKYKKKNKDGSITKVYSKTTFSAGTKINIVKGNHITINDNKTVIKNNRPEVKKEPQRLFTQMFTEQSARIFQTEIFNQTRSLNLGNGGAFIDWTKCNLVEDVKSRLALDNWFKSVGLLKSPKGICTCFRVGSKYIMTALHGITHITRPEYQGLQPNDTDWRAHLDVLRQPNVFVDFEYLTEGEHSVENKFYFNLDDCNTVPFFDESTDSIVLELKCNSDQQLPPAFKYFGLPMLDEKFFLVHHSGGKSKKVEPVDKIVDMNASGTKDSIKIMQDMSERFLINKRKDIARYQCEELPYAILKNRNRLLFHCVCSKGASGCPGIQVTSQGTVVVVTMLLCGYPAWYYSDECANITGEWDKSYTVEQGSNFASIYSEMKRKNPTLFEDIFNSVRGFSYSRTIQAVPPES